MNEHTKRFSELKEAAEAAGEKPVSQEEARELEQLWNKLNLAFSDDRGKDLRLGSRHRSFEQVHAGDAEASRRSSSSTRIFIWSATIAAIVTFGAMLFQIYVIRTAYEDLQNEMQHMRASLVMASLRSDSAAERLDGLLQVAKGELYSDDLREAVVRRLATDPSTNIRLASVRALGPYMSQPEVLTSLREAARMERSPLVILEIVDLVRGVDPEMAEQLLQDIVNEGNLSVHLGTKARTVRPPITNL